MAVTVITPASERDLTTVSAVKESLGIAETDTTLDAFLERLVHAVSDAIEKYSNRIYAKQTYSETVKGSDHPVLLLSQSPIISITSIMADNEPIVDYSVDDADLGTLWRDVGWSRNAWIGWDVEPYAVPRAEKPRYTVVYEAGYSLPGEADTTLPPAVEQAAIITSSDFMMKSMRGGGDIKSKKVGDLVIEYQENADRAATQAGVRIDAIPSAARALLSVRVI